MRDRGVLAVAGALIVAVVVLTIAWAVKERPFTASIPQAPPLDEVALVRLPAGGEVCERGITILPRSQVAEIRIGTRGAPPVPLTYAVSGRGYRTSGTVEPTWVDNALIPIALDPPDRPVHGTFCVRNDGRRSVDLYGAGGKSQTSAVTESGGRRLPANVVLALRERNAATVASRTGQLADRASAFRPPGPVVLWLLAILVVAGVPLAVGWAMWRATAADQENPRVSHRGVMRRPQRSRRQT